MSLRRFRVAGCVIVAIGVVSPVSTGVAGVGWKPTHRVTVTGRLVDHWTINSPDDCGPVGSGTVTVTFKMTKAKKAEVTIDPVKNAEPNDSLGSWTIRAIGDSFGHVTDIPGQPAKGTVSRVDNTTPRPRADPDEEPCPALDKSDCGDKPFAGQARVEVGGYNRKTIRGNMEGGFGFFFEGGRRVRCQGGSLDGFSSPPSLVGGTPAGEILMKMPSLSRFRHHKVTTVHRTIHKRTSTGDPGSDQYTDDVTRTYTTKFVRIG